MTKFYLTVKIDMKLSKANCIPCDPVSLPSNVAKNRDFHLSPGDINPFVCSEVMYFLFQIKWRISKPSRTKVILQTS